MKRKRWFSIGALCLLAITSPFWSKAIVELTSESLASSWTNYSIENITVNGLDRLSRDSILVTAEIPTGNSPFDCRTDIVRARIESIPWVKSAKVRRKLPDELIIDISERKPVALLRSAETVLLTSDGVAIPAPNEQWIWELPIITPPHPIIPHAGAKVQDSAVLSLLNELSTAQKSAGTIVPNISEFFIRENEMFATLIQPPLTVRLGRGVSELNWISLQELIQEHRETFWSRTDIDVDLRIPGNIIVSKQIEQEPTEEQEIEHSTTEEQVKA